MTDALEAKGTLRPDPIVVSQQIRAPDEADVTISRLPALRIVSSRKPGAPVVRLESS